jgi:hypothetical protein
MKTLIFRIVSTALALLVIAFVAVQLLGHHSPTVDILGSYFPAWMVCIISGLTLTFIVHGLFKCAT